MRNNRVRIHAPIGNCAPFTSTRRAQHFIRRGLAFINGSDELEFFERPAGFLARLESSQFERAIQEGRGDRLYWNGSSKKRHATHKPGQVRS
jgi:hypothetical protein